MSTASSSPIPDARISEPRQSNPIGLWMAGSFLVIILFLGAAVIVLSTRDTESDTQITDEPTATAFPTPVDMGKGFSAPMTDRWGNRIEVPVNKFGQVLPQDPDRRLDPESPGWTTRRPAGLMWQIVYDYPIPFSTSDGPSRIEGTVASGYAHTPQGAVLAGIDMMARCSAIGDDVAYDCWKHRLIDDGVLYSDLEEVAQRRGNGPAPTDNDTTTPPLAWVKIINYADDYMAFDVAQLQPSIPGAYAVYPVEMVWHDGDWKGKPKTTSTARQGVTDLDGFTRW